MTSLLKGLIFFGLVVSASTAFSRPVAEVRCMDGNCWKYGWTTSYPGTPHWAQVTCYGDDCAANGWHVRDSRGGRVDVECIGRGCHTDGFVETVNGRSQTFLCHDAPQAPNTPVDEQPERSCWTYGFTASGPHVFQTTSCLNGDCRGRGWVNEAKYGRGTQALCIAGRNKDTGRHETDCFAYGWNLYQ